VSILGFLIVVSLALGGLAWLFFVWTVKSGQYEDPEGAKYRMLEDEEGDEGGTPTATPTPSPTTTPTATTTTSPTTTATTTPTTSLSPTRR
jgi:cbb3-type cytochrome oxidase maturation protein